MTEVRLLVLSDIHTCDEDPSSFKTSSYVSTQGKGPTGAVEPISHMIEIVKKTVGAVDFVLCAGDLTQQALPAGLTYIASQLRQVASLLQAKHLVVVNGNHDVDSRHKFNSYDPRGHLRQSLPDMPFISVDGDAVGAREGHLEYFAEHVSMRTFGDVRIVAVDSSAFHGAGTQEAPEYKHGRMSPIMLKALEEKLKADNSKYLINILICHHHPLNNNVFGEQDSTEMDGGSALLDLLDSGGFGEWFIIHGHKHRPRLRFAPGEVVPPIVLSAASLSAQLADSQNRAPNQFHVVTFDPALSEKLKCGLAGSVQSWSWVPGMGWSPASSSDGLPSRAGFGYRGQIPALASSLASALKAVHPPRAFWEWDEIVDIRPEVSTLLPKMLDQLMKSLEEQHGVKPSRDDRNGVLQLGIPDHV